MILPVAPRKERSDLVLGAKLLLIIMVCYAGIITIKIKEVTDNFIQCIIKPRRYAAM